MKEGMKEALQFYDKNAKLYSEHTFQRLMQYQLNEFISRLPKNAKVLDVGCGSGRDSLYFYDFGLDVTAIDTSENIIKVAKEKAPEISYKKMDLRKMSFPEESFDGVWMMATLSSIEKKDAVNALKEIARVLKKDGILYMATKEGNEEMIEKKPEYNNFPRFYAYYNQLELEQLLKSAGFTILTSVVEDDSGQNWVEIFARLSS